MGEIALVIHKMWIKCLAGDSSGNRNRREEGSEEITASHGKQFRNGTDFLDYNNFLIRLANNQ